MHQVFRNQEIFVHSHSENVILMNTIPQLSSKHSGPTDIISIPTFQHKQIAGFQNPSFKLVVWNFYVSDIGEIESARVDISYC